MTEEYNIFGNLEEICNSNLLTKFRQNLESAKPVQSSSRDNNDDYDIDVLLNKDKAVVSPVKAARKKRPTCSVKKAGRVEEVRSPADKQSSEEPILQALSNEIEWPVQDEEEPVSRRTRNSEGRRIPIANEVDSQEQPQTLTDRSGSGGGRGRDRDRGRARGPRAKTVRPNNINNTSAVASCEALGNTARTSPPATIEAFVRSSRRGRGRGRSSVMKGRRNYIAEIAARCANVDYVDLVSSPLPRIEGVICVDSDDEESTQSHSPNTPARLDCTVAKNNALEISFDDENPEISVKVNWKGKPEVFKLRKYQKFAHIFKILAEREETDVEHLVLNINNKIINPDDTPDSIDYKIFEFISGRVLAERFSSPSISLSTAKKHDINRITLKIQSDRWKRPIQLDLLKSDKFRILYIKCSEELNTSYEQFKLSFDGETLEYNDTPADLDLEGGEAIDLCFRK